MYLQFTLKNIKAISVLDNPFNPIDRRSEFYQTWQLCGMEQLESEEICQWARQGFSVTGSPDKGASFSKGEERKLYDPKIAFSLPDDLKENEIRRYRFDIHWWESDRSTEKVRAVFTDATLKTANKAWMAAGENEKKAKEVLNKWLYENPGELLNAISAFSNTLGISNPPWISSAVNLLPVMKMLLDIVKNNADDYLGMHRLEFELKKTATELVWRFNSVQTSIEQWHAGEGQQELELEISDATSRNTCSALYQCRILD